MKRRSDDSLYPVYEIHWVDSTSCAEWSEVDAMDEHPMDCVSIGFLISETNDRVVISTTYDSNEHAVDPLAIPKVAITGMWQWHTPITKKNDSDRR